MARFLGICVFVACVAVGCGSMPPAVAPVDSAREVPSDVVDLRGIWLKDGGVDPEPARERGLDASRIETPRKVVDVAPRYPLEASIQGITGTVTVECIIEISGEPTACVVTGGSMDLRSVAMTAVRQWRWRPLSVDGEPSRSLVQLTINFAIDRPLPR